MTPVSTIFQQHIYIVFSGSHLLISLLKDILGILPCNRYIRVAYTLLSQMKPMLQVPCCSAHWSDFVTHANAEKQQIISLSNYGI